MKNRTGLRPARPHRAAVPSALHPLGLAALLAVCGPAFALPQGATVVNGKVTVQNPSSVLTVVTQGTSKAIVDWKSFSIGSGETVRFNQPSSSAVLLNRVTGYDPSSILGQLQSNGQIFLLNPQGVVFGANSRIDVGGMVASTLAITNTDFLASRYELTSADGMSAGMRGVVRNDGTISAPAGTVVLAGPRVTNAGTIEAAGGRVGLAAANRVLVDVEGDGLVLFDTTGADAGNRLAQLGRIQADGGSVELRAAARGAFADTVLNMTGVVQARGLGLRDGRVVIDGGNAGITRVAGTVDVGGDAEGGQGGRAAVLGRKVLLDDGAALLASGPGGGGTVLVGGNWQGGGPERNAEMTHVAAGARIDVSGSGSGSGGTAVVWADKDTRYYGHIDASAGAQGGDGGRIEVSGKNTLSFAGTAAFSSTKGGGGLLLLDPSDITIEDAASSADMSAATPFEGGATNSTLDVNVLVAALNTAGPGTIVVDATAGGGGAANGGTITIDTPGGATADLAWAGQKGLRLVAGNGITVNADSPVSNTGTGGIDFFTGGAVQIDSDVTLAGGTFTVAGLTGGATRAASFTAAVGANIVTGGGDLAIATSGAIRTRGIDTAGVSGLQVGGDGGTVTLSTSNAGITTDAITTSGGASTGGPGADGAANAGGDAGNVSITTSTSGGTNRTIQTGTITALGGAGGTSTSTNGTGGTGGDGGAVTLTAQTSGTVIVGAIDTSAGAGGGGGPAIGPGGAGGAGGTAGAVQLSAAGATGTVTLDDVTTLGGAGGASTGAATAGTPGANAGLTVTAGLNITANGSIDTGGTAASTVDLSFGQSAGGDLDLRAAGPFTADTVTATGGSGTDRILVQAGVAENITITAAVMQRSASGADIDLTAVDRIAITDGTGTNIYVASAWGGALRVTATSGAADDLTGNGANTTLVGTDNGSTFTVRANNSTLQQGANTTTFNGVGNLVGGTAADSFVFGPAVGATLAGTIDGGGGGDTLDLSAKSGTLSINLQTGAASNVNGGADGGFTNVATFVGNGADTTLTGTNSATTFTVTADRSGTAVSAVGTADFQGIGNLVGGTAADAFVIGAGFDVDSLNGGTGTNTLSVDATAGGGAITLTNTLLTRAGAANTTLSTNITVATLNGNAGNDAFTATGWTGTRTLTVNASAGTDSLAGTPTAANTTLVGTSTGSTFSVTGTNSGTLVRLAETTTFSSVGNLTGGTGADTFALTNSGTIAGNLNGGTGATNTLDLSAKTSATISIAEATGAVTGTGFGIGGTTTNIDGLIGNGANTTLVGSNNPRTYLVSGADEVQVGGTTYQGVGNVTAGSDDDQFQFAATGTLSGAATGGGGSDAFDLSGKVGVAVVFNQQTGAVTSAGNPVVGSQTGFESLVGNGTNTTIVGPNAGQTFTLAGDQAGTAGTLGFTAVTALTGGSGADTLAVASDVGTITLLNGSIARTGLATINLSGFEAATLAGGAGANAIDASGFAGTVTVQATTGADTVTGNGANTTLLGTNTGSTFTVDADDGGTLVRGANTTTFTAVANLTGGTGADDFVIDAGVTLSGSISGSITGGGADNTLDLSGRAAANFVLTGANAGTASGVGAGFSAIDALTGNGTSSTLTGTNTASTFNVTAANAGNVNGTIDFSGVANLTGGSAADSFTFDAAGTLSGAIVGGGTTNTLNLSAKAGAVAIDLAAATATGVGTTFSGISSFVGNDPSTATANTTLTGPNATTTWTVNAANAGGLTGGIAFSGVGNLAGGSGADSFVLSTTSAALGGSVDGGGGANSLDLAAKNTANFTLTGAASGTVNSVLGGFADIGELIGNTSSSTLTGSNAGSTFNVTGTNSGNVDGTLTFSGMRNLTGGTGADTFAIAAAGALDGNVDGGATGLNTLDLSARTGGLSVNLASGGVSGSGIGGTQTNFGSYVGNDGTTGSSSLLVGANGGTTITVTGVNQGTAGTTQFAGFGRLTGGTGADTFVFQAPGRIVGAASGAGGTDTLDLSGKAGAVVVNQQTSAASENGTAIVGSFATMEALLGNNTNTTVVGPNAGQTFTLAGDLAGAAGALAFSGVTSLAGGSGTDTLVVADDVAAITLTDASIARTGFTTIALSGFEAASLAGGAGANTIFASGFTGNVTVQASAGIDDVTGNGANTVLVGTAASSTFTVSGVDAGTLASGADSTTFSGVGGLTGGGGDDSFVVLNAGTLSGSLDGGGGANTLDLSGKAAATIVFDQGSNSVTGAGIAGTLSNIDTLIGNGANTTLLGNSAGQSFVISGDNQITVGGAQVYQGVGNLSAGTGADSITGNAAFELVGDIGDAGGATTLSGTIRSGGAQTYSGAITAPTVALVAGADIAAANAGNDFGTLSITTSGAAGATIVDGDSLVLGAVSLLGSGADSITVGAAAGSTLSRSAALLVADAPTLTVGGVQVNNNVRNFFVSGAADSVAVQAGAGGAHNLSATGVGALPALTVTGNLNLTAAAATDLTQSGALAVTGTSTLTAASGNVTLANAGNDFVGGVTVTGDAVSLRDANALDVVALTSTSGQSVSLVAGGALTVSGAIDTGAGNITLSSGAALATPGALSGNDISLTGADGLTIGASVTASGSLSLSTTNAAVSQTAGAIVATGATTVTAGTGGVSLARAGNDFSTVAFSGASRGAVTLVDASDLNVTALPATANRALSLTAGGQLTLPADGLAIDTGTADLTLRFATLGSTLGDLSGADVAITGTAGLASLGNIAAGASLTLVATDAAIGQQAGTSISAVGATTVNAGSGNVTLTNAGNDFASVAVTGGAVRLRDTDALTVTALSSGTNQAVSVVAGGALTLPAGPIDTGTANLTLSTGGTLSSPGALNGATISLTGAGGLTIGSSITASTGLNLATTDATINQTGGTIDVAGPTTVTAGTGNVSLARAGNDFASLGVTGGTVTVTDANALVLGSIAAGSLAVDTSAGNGAVTQSGAVVVNGATVVDAGSGNVTLGNAGNNFGSIGVTGGAVVVTDQNAVVLGATDVGSLTLDAGGAVTQNAAVSVAGASTVDAGSGNVTLTNAANDFGSLAVSGGTISVRDANAINLSSATVAAGRALTVTAGGTITLNGSITTSADQTYAGNVQLGANTALDAGAGRIALQGTVTGGGRNLSLTSTAAAADAIGIGGAVGNVGVFSANGNTTLGGSVTSTGAQTYDGALALAGNATLDAGGAKLDLRGAVDGNGRNLSLASSNAAADAVRIGGAIAGVAQLNVTGPATIGAAVTTTGNQTYSGDVALAADTALSAGAGRIALQGAVAGGGHDLTLASTAAAANAITTGAAISGVAAFTASGNTTLGGDVTSTGSQTYDGALALAADATIAAGGGRIDLREAVDGGGNDLALVSSHAAADAIRVGAAIGNVARFSATGRSTLAANVSTTGAQTYSAPVTLATDTALAGSSVGFGGTVDGAFTLAVDAANTRFDGDVGAGTALASLTTNAAGTTRIGGDVRTTGNQVYNDAVVLVGPSTLTGARLTFNRTIDGAHALGLVAAGAGVALEGAVGASTALDSLSVTGPATLGAGRVTTTGAQSYAGAVTLDGDATLAGGSFDFGDTVDGAHALVLQSGGTTRFGGDVGGSTALDALSATGGGAVRLAGSAIETTGAQSYGGALQLGGSTRITGSSLTFSGPVSGAQDLVLRTDTLVASGAISGTGTLSVTPDTAGRSVGVAGGAGGLQLSQALLDRTTGFTQHVVGRTDGTGEINVGDLTLGADTTLQTGSGDIRLNGSVDGAFALALNSGGTTRIAGPIGATAALASLTTDNQGGTGEGTLFDRADATGSARVITTGAQTYADAVTSTVPLTLDGSVITALLAANRFDGPVSANATRIDLASGTDVTLGDVTLADGGQVQTDGVLTLDGALRLDGGTLVLVGAGTPTALPSFTLPEVVGRDDITLGLIPVSEASETIRQSDGSSITASLGSLLVLRAPNGGSIRIDRSGNDLRGEISAVSGTLNDTDASRFGSAGGIVLGVVNIASTEINVAGLPPADGDQTALRAGIEGDALRLSTDRLTTGTQGEIVARLPFDNTQGTQTSVPGLTLVMGTQALALGGQFGNTSEGSVQVRVGGTRGGYLTVRPKGVGSETAYILLSGPFDVVPFYDGAGKITEVRVFYNGASARTAQEAGALSAVRAVVEDARQAQFQEAVRTENVSSRLRSGVVAEVGSGRPATVGTESIRLPQNCDVKGKTLQCQ